MLKLGLMASEQNEALENVYLQRNAANVKRADIAFHFFDGVSESDKVNELFRHISNVTARVLTGMRDVLNGERLCRNIH